MEREVRNTPTLYEALFKEAEIEKDANSAWLNRPFQDVYLNIKREVRAGGHGHVHVHVHAAGGPYDYIPAEDKYKGKEPADRKLKLHVRAFCKHNKKVLEDFYYERTDNIAACRSDYTV